jgi:hypothetical protein
MDKMMTREKALEILKYNSNVIHQTTTGTTDTKEVEALDMAIKALKAMNQIYKITDGYAEALYQSEFAFDGVISVLTEYFEVEKNDKDRI